jgi:hypothetical protein
MTDHKRRIVTAVLVSLAFAILLVVSIAASFLYTTASVNHERIMRETTRAPACQLAYKLIQQEASPQQHTDLALYDATGCPKVLTDTGK